MDVGERIEALLTKWPQEDIEELGERVALGILAEQLAFEKGAFVDLLEMRMYLAKLRIEGVGHESQAHVAA